MSEIRPVTAADADALVAFVATIPAADRTFFKEEMNDPEIARGWTDDTRPGQRWVAVTDGGVSGYVTVVPLPGWSDHVGEIRLVVSPDRRGTGLGRQLARTALQGALATGLSKVIVELVADQASALRMFSELGFVGEALLTAHVRDRGGQLGDLIMLAHYVDQNQSMIAALGVADELLLPGGPGGAAG
jgi:GNAT superfamily N-acetyltransferase